MIKEMALKFDFLNSFCQLHLLIVPIWISCSLFGVSSASGNAESSHLRSTQHTNQYRQDASASSSGNHNAHRREVGQTRIIDGEDAPEGRFPWMVFYSFNDESLSCGGSLIAPDLVLTNAHCVGDGLDLGFAYIGRFDTSDRQEGGPIRPVVARIPHPDYVAESDGFDKWNNDVALLKLDRAPTTPFTITLNSNPDFPEETGFSLLALGWGSVTNGVDAPFTSSEILQQGEVNFIDFEDCSVAEDPETGARFGLSPTNTAVTPDWFCTKGEVAHMCRGDSGGPVIRPGASPRQDLLVAIISREAGGCDNPYLPHINQDVSYHYAWITRTACEISDNPPAEWCGSSPTSAPISLTPRPTPRPTSRPPTRQPSIIPPVQPTSSPVTTRPTDLPTMISQQPTSESHTPTILPTSLPTNIPSLSQPDDNGTIGSPDESTSSPQAEDLVPSLAPSDIVLGPDEDEREEDDTQAPASADIGNSTETSMPTEFTTKVTLHVKILFDDKPQHIGWYVADKAYERFRVAVPMGTYLAGDQVANEDVEVEGGEDYQFVINDLAGDGLSGGGSYEVFLGEDFGYEVLASGSGDFGETQHTEFFVPCNVGACASSRFPTSTPPSVSGAPTSIADPTLLSPSISPTTVDPTDVPSIEADDDVSTPRPTTLEPTIMEPSLDNDPASPTFSSTTPPAPAPSSASTARIEGFASNNILLLLATGTTFFVVMVLDQ